MFILEVSFIHKWTLEQSICSSKFLREYDYNSLDLRCTFFNSVTVVLVVVPSIVLTLLTTLLDGLTFTTGHISREFVAGAARAWHVS